MATLIKPDGSATTVTPASGGAFTLEELQGFVGGYIEFVHVGDRILVVDEDGKAKGKPFNRAATERCHGYIFSDDGIVGDALLCESTEVN